MISTKKYIGIDIGGTKCAVVRGGGRTVDGKIRFETTGKDETIANIFDAVRKLITPDCAAIGVSCGGPLDPEKGIIMSPPNLQGGDDVHITWMLTE